MRAKKPLAIAASGVGRDGGFELRNFTSIHY
jgi:hypothetical protein